MASCHGKPLFTGNRFDHLIAGASEEVAQDTPIVLLVLYDQNPLAHLVSNWRSTRIGSVNRKVEPRPGLDSTQMRPPCRSMMRLAIDSPRPVPPLVPSLNPSAW